MGERFTLEEVVANLSQRDLVAFVRYAQRARGRTPLPESEISRVDIWNDRFDHLIGTQDYNVSYTWKGEPGFFFVVSAIVWKRWLCEGGMNGNARDT